MSWTQVCTLRSEAKPSPEAFSPAVKRSGWQPPQDTGLWDIAGQVQDQVRTHALTCLPFMYVCPQKRLGGRIKLCCPPKHSALSFHASPFQLFLFPNNFDQLLVMVPATGV